ncbi:hypothetical protein DFH09DRAFT_1124578 [Mycena vulgaris]|nr:hypothetical protein DFH09DRAFT_1124578 [Mycena vulgaris]
MRFNLAILSLSLSVALVTAVPLSYATHQSDPNAKKSDLKTVDARDPLSQTTHLSDPNAKKGDAKKVARVFGDLKAR